MEITAICRKVNNFFVKEEYSGWFELKVSKPPVELLEGQYFRVVGSVLNDKVYQNTPESLATIKTESFSGKIIAMAVPPDFLELIKEMEEFDKKLAEMNSNVKSCFTSESFSGYSYSISSSLPASMQEWYSQINKQLGAYRRIGR